MLGLTKPKHFIPIHGEFRMQVQHGRLAIETGVAPENVFIIENGQPIEIFADGSARRGQQVPAGYVFVDGLSVGDVGEIVLRDRRALANDGMFMVVVTVDKQTGNVVGRPEIITRGFVHLNEQDPIMDEAIDEDPRVDPEPGRPHQRGRAAEEPDQGRRVALPVRADEAPADGLPGRGRDLMATRRRTTTRAPAPPQERAERQPRGRPLDRRDRPARAGRGHADRARAARPGRADRLVARLDRAVVRDRPLVPAVPPARGRLVRRVGPRQAARLRLGHDAARDRDRLRRLPRRVRGPRPDAGGGGARRRPDRPVRGGHPRAAAHEPRRVRRAAGNRHRRADARVQPPPAAGREAGHRDREVGRRRGRGLDAARAGGGRTGPDGAVHERQRQRHRQEGRRGRRRGRREGRRGHDLVARPDRDLGRRGRRRVEDPGGGSQHAPDLGDVRPGHERRRARRLRDAGRGSAPTGAGARRRDRRRRLAADEGADRVPPATARAARGRRRPDRAGRQQGRPRAQRGDHRPEAGELRDHRPDRRPQRRPGRDPVRGPARGRRPRVADRGPRRRPRDGPRRPQPPDRGADPRQERDRHRDPEPGLQRRRPPADLRGGPVQRRRSRS